MQLNVIAVGRRMPAWIREAFTEFNRRLPAELRLNLVEVAPVTRGKNVSREKTVAEEGGRIRSAIPDDSRLVVLDEKGRQLDSRSLANQVSTWQREGHNITFIIGGADGLHDNIKKSADMTWSLSSLTLPHGMVRVILAEQIYRAWTILNNHPYHRE